MSADRGVAIRSRHTSISTIVGDSSRVALLTLPPPVESARLLFDRLRLSEAVDR